MTDATLSIGEVASRAGINVSAIRFYEQQGLLPEPERVSGQRRYTAAIIQRLGVIDTAKQASLRSMRPASCWARPTRVHRPTSNCGYWRIASYPRWTP